MVAFILIASKQALLVADALALLTLVDILLHFELVRTPLLVGNLPGQEVSRFPALASRFPLRFVLQLVLVGSIQVEFQVDCQLMGHMYLLYLRRRYRQTSSFLMVFP